MEILPEKELHQKSLTRHDISTVRLRRKQSL